MELTWPETNLGDTAVIECPCGGVDLNSTGLIARRFCGGTYETGAVWQPPEDTRCNFTITTRQICRLAQVLAFHIEIRLRFVCYVYRDHQKLELKN